jgi:inhibitor of KinA sporulation pathway (predicted exonuclease)
MVTCGDYDAKVLKREAEYKDFFIPGCFKSWINIKKVFPIHMFDKSRPRNMVGNIQNVKKAAANGMDHMLEIMGVKLEGRHHSGIDDTKNIARIVLGCIENGFEFHQGHIAYLNYETGKRSEFDALGEGIDEMELSTYEPDFDPIVPHFLK